MGKILIKFILTAVLTYGLAQLLPNVRLDGVGSAAVLVIVMGLLNATVKPILKIIGFPITVLTLGIFLLVINVIIVKLADYLMNSFSVTGFVSTLIFSLALSLVTIIVDMVVE
ncbi:phage holin family protein [Hymenobacter psoromatis]|uniref:phage holin family protein n=1 Tax=Hymenobacter psoromatis TaxID=1484116 RepID=UPI001CBEA22C|nr:phage holin family protein [Hymenobacter psoromatis]